MKKKILFKFILLNLSFHTHYLFSLILTCHDCGCVFGLCVLEASQGVYQGQGAAFSGLEPCVSHTCVSSANCQRYKKPSFPFTWFHVASVTSSVKLSTEPLSVDKASGVLFYFRHSGACY